MNDLWETIAQVVLSGNETEEVELKETLSLEERPGRAELARDISAIANRNGGYIVAGVQDARHRTSTNPEEYVVGWQGDLDETERIIREALAMFCEPPPRITVHTVPVPGTARSVLVIAIPRSYARPHAIIRASGVVREHEIWVRDGPQVRRATPRELEEMIRGQRNCIIVNFHHPLTDEQKEQIRLLMNMRIEDVIPVPVHFEHDKEFHSQAVAYVDRVGLTSHQWQTKEILVSLPGYSPAAAAILAEIHGRMGHFPSVLRLRPVGEGATRYEVAEVMNLQAIRDGARSRR